MLLAQRLAIARRRHSRDYFVARDLDRLRYFGNTSILSDCPSLRFVLCYDDHFPELPPADCADESDGQSLDKWLFVPRVPKCHFDVDDEEWPSQIQGLKAVIKISSFKNANNVFLPVYAFSNASSRANFIVICNSADDDDHFIVPFHLSNRLIGEQLALKSANNNNNNNNTYFC
ncbi:hypothetical protein niasHT_012652 [Heterodera trifolii]|uniref:Uncharacterized protein n=1 Tax=Heterodera trifolii TaxID=157864 RepID=A0ABD2L2T5_9BILA